jgi:predicted DNA-binding transcriptional regulator AlpA
MATQHHNAPMREAEAARYIGMSPAWLRKVRHLGIQDQPPYVKVGNVSIRYFSSDLDNWLQKHRVDPGEAA